MRAIFISYRRDDTEGYAGRLFRDLRERFGKDAVFMDVAGIEPGRDFRRVIENQVASCGVLLALIGKAWLTVADDSDKRRLDDPNDFVRLETASALKRDIPVIPVLVQQAEMPRAEQLPDDLKDLAFRNSVELTHARWESDVELLIAALRRYVDPPQPGAAAAAPAVAVANTPPGSGRQPWIIVPLATVALGGVAYFAWDRFGPGSDEPKDRAVAAAGTGAASTPALTAAPAPLLAPSPASTAATVLGPTPAPLAAAAAPQQALSPGAQASAPARPSVPPRQPSSARAAEQASAPAPASVDAVAPRRTVAAPAAPQPASARHVEQPVVARAAAPAPAYAPAPSYAAAPSSAPAPAPQTPSSTTATRSTPAATVAAAPSPAPPAATVTAPAESPAAEAVLRHDRSLDLLGSPGSPSMVTRTIVIKPDMSYVNVTGDEVIRFEVGDKSFIWNFNGTRNSFDLAQVAPPSVLDRKVTAYVRVNPTLRRR